MIGPEILPEYRAWIKQDKQRSTSKQVDFGYFWTQSGSEREYPRWRVSWIEATGELYACQAAKDRFILLGEIPDRARLDELLYDWAESGSSIYHNLCELRKRINAEEAIG